METHRDVAKRNYCLELLRFSCSHNAAFPLLVELSHLWLPPWNTILSFPIFFSISPTCCKRLWNVNCPLKIISVWNVAQSYSEEYINTPALLHLLPQINSLLSRPPLPLCFLLCVSLCVKVFYPSLAWEHSSSTPIRRDEDKEGEGKQGRERRKERAAGGSWHLSGLFFLVSSVWSSRHNPPTSSSHPAFVCVFTHTVCMCVCV